MAQRISRAKQRIKARRRPRSRCRRTPSGPERLRVVLHVLYLIFNEGYTASSGRDLQRAELTREAIRLAAHACTRLLPDDGEVAGLLALMLLTDARRAARTGPDGDAGPARRAGPRASGTAAAIDEGVALITDALAARAARPVPAAGGDRRGPRRGAARARTPTGRRSSRCTSCSSASRPTRWSRSTARSRVAMVERPARRARPAGHARRRRADGRAPPARRGPRPPAGDGRRPRRGARPATASAARRTTSLPEQRYLEARAARLDAGLSA